jgi:hypothetical protein
MQIDLEVMGWIPVLPAINKTFQMVSYSVMICRSWVITTVCIKS